MYWVYLKIYIKINIYVTLFILNVPLGYLNKDENVKNMTWSGK